MLQLQTSPASLPFRFDGLLGQEDEIEDAGAGKLEPPTDPADEAPSDLDDSPLHESPADYESETGAPAADELRRIEEKFSRTVNIDKQSQ